MVFLLACLVSATRVPTVAGAGSLYLNPATITPLPMGSTFSIQVKVGGMDQFNGWEIQVLYDPTVINATSLTTDGNIFHTNATGIVFELRNCVNGSGTGCCLSSCVPLDGLGIADSASGDTKTTSGSGLLFNLTFNVVSNKPYSPIIIQNDQFSNGGSSGVVHTTISGFYGTTVADLGLTPNTSSLDVVVGYSNTSMITLSSLNHFSGLVNVTAKASDTAITATLNPNQTMVPDGGTAVINLLVHAQANASATSYTVTLIAKSSRLIPHYQHSEDVRVSVHSPDFLVYATPSLLLIHQTSSGSTAITVQSLYYFSGTVNLTVTGPTPFMLSKSSLTVQSGGSNTTTLTIRTRSSLFPFDDEFTINGTSGSLVHSYRPLVLVTPPPGDFSISVSSNYATVPPGSPENVSIGVTSLDYFSGTLYILGTSKSGLGYSFDPVTIFLNYSQTIFFKLKITTDTSTSPGYHSIDLTIYGQQIGKAGQEQPPKSHAMTVTLIITQPPQPVATPPKFLGLQEPMFFSVIGGLALVLAMLGIFETRRSNGSKIRPILEG